MKNVGKALAALVLIPSLMSGCSALGDRMSGSTTSCVLVGAAAGAGATLLVDGGVGAILGGLAGAVMGDVICGANAAAADEDGDGVPNDRDKCPKTPAGVKVFSNGCPLDSDADGVPDYLDKCPNTPRGAEVNADGCPIDSDGDGVPDGIDQCPGTEPGTKVEADGCPPMGGVMMTIEDVNFAFDSARLRPEAFAILDRAWQAMQANMSLNVKLVGHTDSIGPEAYNQGLSERRAKSVMDYLLKNGVAASRMTMMGRGESQPIASNATREGRAQNRRVEIVLSGK